MESSWYRQLFPKTPGNRRRVKWAGLRPDALSLAGERADDGRA
jgi:hypothetical protein